MQALHLGPRNEPGFTRDLREQPADRVQAPFVDAACEQLPRLRHEVCNHAISLRQLIYGRNAVLEAARAGRVVKVYQAAGLGHDPRLEELAKLARVDVVPPAKLDAMAPGVNQGVAAELKPRREWTLKQLLETNPSLLVGLDSIMDPQNLGAILRSAEVAGAGGAIIPEHRSAPLSPASVKASSGAAELMPIARVSGLPSAIAEVKRDGIWCVALDPRGDLADTEIRALGYDPKSIAPLIQANGADASSPSLRQLLVNANREAQVLGHYQVDSIHLLLAMLYSDSPSTSGPLQQAGLTLYDVRRHLQTGSRAGVPNYRDPTRPDTALRKRPWPSLRGVLGISPVFVVIVGATAASGALLWTNLLPRYVALLTILFVVGGWITSLCIHEFGHAFVAYLGGDRSVAGAGYLTLNPLRYANVTMSLVLPVVFLLLGGIALPGGAVYINHSELRSRAWSSAVSIAGPVGTLLCGLAIAAVFTVAPQRSWITPDNITFFGALALLGFFMALAVVLNLLPIPGLDGFGIIRPWLPYSIQVAALRFSMLAIYGVFALLWFVAPVRSAFFGAVLQLTALAGIEQSLIFVGQLNMRFV